MRGREQDKKDNAVHHELFFIRLKQTINETYSFIKNGFVEWLDTLSEKSLLVKKYMIAFLKISFS